MSQKLNTHLSSSGQPASDTISPSGSARVACAGINSACAESLQNRTAAGGDSFQDDEDAQFAARLLHYVTEIGKLGIEDEVIVTSHRGYGHKESRGVKFIISPDNSAEELISAETFPALIEKIEAWKASGEERKAKRVEQLRAELSKLEGGAL